MIDRRDFIRTSALTGIGVSLGASVIGQALEQSVPQGKRVGIIGLDTSHSIAFTKSMNAENAGNSFLGYKVVAAYPQGSLDIPSSVERIAGYTKQIQEMGVKISLSI